MPRTIRLLVSRKQSLTQTLIRTSVLEADGVNNTLYVALLEADLTPLRSDVASDVV